ncbi:MAG: glycerol-3-phosphate acyltransferase [Dehalococcoidia bacterium]|nr:glycerol-3-phosphate acyltransferase [Dehalococcoidia bacterium]
MVVPFVLLALGAYLLGSVPAAYLAVKWSRGLDIRKVGTGKSGASNVLRAAGKRLAIPVAIFDIGKGALAVWVAQLTGLNTSQQVMVGLMAVIGHNWSVFLKFGGGGRGVFATLGMVAVLSWKLALVVLFIAYMWVLIKQVALGVAFGVFLAFLAMPLLVWFLPEFFNIQDRVAVTLGMVAIALIAFTKRLIAPKSDLAKSTPWRTILLNRLLFDRDIGDMRLWVRNGAAANK